MDGNVLRQVHDYAQDNIRDKRFVTFAQFGGDDSAACFDLDNPGSVVILDITGEPFGFDHCKTYSDAYAWAKDAINLMVRYDL